MFTTTNNENTIPIIIKNTDTYAQWLADQPEHAQQWLLLNDFKPVAGKFLSIPNKHGGIEAVIVGSDADKKNTLWSLANLPNKLTKGTYEIQDVATDEYESMAIGWGLACYHYDRYKKHPQIETALYLPANSNESLIRETITATAIVRDLINTPANDLGPTELAEEATKITKNLKAECTIIRGDDLLEHYYPAIHAVGRASSNPPCLIDIRWGSSKDPMVTLVGKGVTFDTGGLDVKSLSGMKLMKKDMGGAAHVLGIAHMIITQQLPIRLRVLIPAVENAISSNAYRPQDVINTRKGTTIEIISTDAEGRVILADALYEAASENPELIIDFATLTGAARVALGTEVPALFANDNALAINLMTISMQENDPLWHMPLWQDYKCFIESDIAEISNTPSVGTGGAISAALFLEHFVESTPWMHIDLMAWNTSSRPGRPKGGEAMGVRALYHYLQQRYGKN